MRKIFAMIVVAVFLAGVAGMSFAADKWVVIKDSNGKCSVRKAKGETPKTVAGPFNTKAEAEKAKQEKCPPAKKK